MVGALIAAFDGAFLVGVAEKEAEDDISPRAALGLVTVR